MSNQDDEKRQREETALSCVKLFVRPELARAFARCTWLAQQETGRSRLELMEELITDFLKRYGC
jgi:hypothetical protein